MKKTLNQLKASKRNFALMQTSGIIAHLVKIYNSTTDFDVRMRTNNLILSLNSLRTEIENTNYESWKA